MAAAKKNPEQLKRIYEALGDRLDFTLAKLIQEDKPIPPALATAAAGYLKLHKVGEQIAESEAKEVAANAMTDFVPRLTPEELAPSPWNAEDAERTRIANEREALGIKPVTLLAAEQKQWDDLNQPPTNNNEENF